MTVATVDRFDAALIPLYKGGSADDTREMMRVVIENAIVNQPRSLQTRIGPSQLGTECDVCLVLMLAEVPGPTEVSWLPFIGTCVHAELDLIAIRNEARTGQSRFLSELTVTVGDVDGTAITGHCDLFDIWTGTVVDYKVVGTATLRSARANGPTGVYRTQAHLYGRGWARLGYQVAHVAIWYLPRNEPELSNGIFWTEPYDEQTALAALERASFWAGLIRELGLQRALEVAGTHRGDHSCRHTAGYVPNPRSRPDTVAGLLDIN